MSFGHFDNFFMHLWPGDGSITDFACQCAQEITLARWTGPPRRDPCDTKVWMHSIKRSCELRWYCCALTCGKLAVHITDGELKNLCSGTDDVKRVSDCLKKQRPPSPESDSRSSDKRRSMA